MISAWWLILAVFGGVFLGMFLMGLMAASRDKER